MVIDVKKLAEISYFVGLEPEELEAVRKHIAGEKLIEKGRIFLIEEEQTDYMYFITSGAVKVYKRSANGKEQILSISTKGDTLNDVSTFDGGGCATNMLAMTPVHLYSIKKKDMLLLVTSYPKIALNVAKVLASKVRRDSSLVEVLSFDQVLSRLARLLQRQSAMKENILPQLTQQDLASMVGTSRVVVNRSLRVMEEKGAIRLQRRRIIITNEKVLNDLVR